MFLIRKIKGGIQCVKDNGFYYTIVLFWEKAVNKVYHVFGSEKRISLNKFRKLPPPVFQEGDCAAYVKYEEQLNLKLRNPSENPEFVNISERPYVRQRSDTKLLAWYLPQYYPMEVNDKYHGKGFTEWACAARGIPLFEGHYQPHLPYDVGFYTLTNVDTLQRQVELANRYGIYGFCFDYYWFSGTRTMEKPVELFLKHKELNLHYCMNWCTENWTALWDGENKDLIFEQKLLDGDDRKFMEDLRPYLEDERYVKIDGKPVLMVYQCRIFERERFKLLMENFRACAKEFGFPGLYVMLSTSGHFDEDVKEWGADALAEYPTINLADCPKCEPTGYLNPNYWNNHAILDFEGLIREKRYLRTYHNDNVYYASLTNFDNSPRKAYSPNCMITVKSTPSLFRDWLKTTLKMTAEKRGQEENYAFVLAWNEWAEGACLEPDMYFGYGYLQAVQDALEDTRADREINENVILDELAEKKKLGVTDFSFYIHCIESVGDIVACEPIARYLKKLEKTSKVFWIVKKSSEEIVKYNPYVDGVITVEYLSQSIDIINEKRQDPHNIIIDCHQSGRRCVVTDRIHKNPNNPQVNEFTYLNYGSLLKNFCYSAGLPGLDDAPVFHQAPDIEVPSDLPKRYVVFHCKSAEECKDWDPKKWKELAQRIMELGYSVVEIGMEPIVRSSDKRYYDGTKIRNFQTIAQIVKQAVCFIGVDSAFAHIANCFGVYGILIFGKYKYFHHPMMYTGGYADGSRAAILFAEGDLPAREIPVDTVFGEFQRIGKSGQENL